MSDLEDLIREAGRKGVTYMMSHAGGKPAFASAYHRAPRSHYSTATHADPVEALKAAIHGALYPPSKTSLADLLD